MFFQELKLLLDGCAAIAVTLSSGRDGAITVTVRPTPKEAKDVELQSIADRFRSRGHQSTECKVLQLASMPVNPAGESLLHQRLRHTRRIGLNLPRIQPAKRQHEPTTKIKTRVEASGQ